MRRSLRSAVVVAAVLVPTTTAAALAVSAQEGPAGLGSSPARAFTVMGDHGQSMESTSEYDYLRHMVAHHEEAVGAARELARSDRSRMRSFGRDVVATQTEQVRVMRSWLATWYPGASTATPYQPMMRDLSELSGDRLDRAFLQDMVVHHMAAVMMSQHFMAGGASEHRAVTDLARTIRDEQHAEIMWMRSWSFRWFGAIGAPGGHGGGPMATAPHHHVKVW
jgi:uncharacterized protein (DUF305 family)